ncbi:MAG TPA: hypothetical protein VNJ01_08605 [Bacteriovoracaceae bacterium]|nr:hypothetical protein [Bacteriovoracaceae bacterium]
MKILFYSCILITSLASHAGISRIEVKSFNFDYNDPKGEGKAAVFTRSEKSTTAGATVSVDRVGENFRLVVAGARPETFELINAPKFMTEASTMSVRSFNGLLDQTVKLSLQNGTFKSAKNSLLIEGLSLDCNKASVAPVLMDQLISGCIQRMSLQTSKFLSESREDGVSELIIKSIVSAVDFGKGIDGQTDVKGVDLRVDAGKFTAVATVKMQINGKIKSKGFVSYDQARGRLSVRVDEVKFGILGITGKVFDELKKHESEKIKVNKPYVYYQIR